MKTMHRLYSVLSVCFILICLYVQQQTTLNAEPKTLENHKVSEIKISKGTVFQVDNETLNASALSPPHYDIREVVPIPNSSNLLINIYEKGKSRICSADSQFKSITPLTEGHLDEGIAVTADGKFLLFDREIEGNRDIYRMKIDGTNLERLTTNPAQDFSGSWSPDGTKIVFARDGSERIGIYVMSADGSEQNPLLIDEDDNLDPSWSPAGEMIAFSKNGQIPCLFRLEDNKWRPVISMTLFCRYPSWLPDGDGIAFTGTLKHKAHRGYDIYTVQQEWTVIRKLTGTKLPKSSPNFSSDGNIMYYCESGDSNQGKGEMK